LMPPNRSSGVNPATPANPAVSYSRRFFGSKRTA
jgi:hypothetical protein